MGVGAAILPGTVDDTSGLSEAALAFVKFLKSRGLSREEKARLHKALENYLPYRRRPVLPGDLILWRELQATRYFPVISDYEADVINRLIDNLPEAAGVAFPDDVVVVLPGPTASASGGQEFQIEVDPSYRPELLNMLQEVMLAIDSEPKSIRDPERVRPYNAVDGLSDIACSFDFWRWADRKSSDSAGNSETSLEPGLRETHDIREALVMVLKKMIDATG